MVEGPVGNAEDEPLTELETFVALVAHEVRTPLTIVKAAVTMLATLESDPASAAQGTRQEILAMVERNVDLAILLMDRMSLARDLERGTLVLDAEQVDLAELVHQSVGDLRSATLREHPVEVVADEALLLQADATAVREIVFNLLSNAGKYSASNAAITVTLQRVDGFAQVVVRNHGSGVTPGDTEHIFEKFFQGDARSSGVGLGLFVSRGLARAHGGDITVRPAQDEGSEFVLELPISPVV